MARFLTETYSTGSFIDGKTADVGGVWDAVATTFDSGTDAPIAAGVVTVSGTTVLAFKNSAVPGSANQDVTVEFTPTGDNWFVGIALRRNASTGAQYLARISAGSHEVVRLTSGTDWPGTEIGNAASSPIAAGNRASHTLRASIDASGNLRAWVDGAATTWTQSGTAVVTDTNITAAGEAGFWGRAITSSELTGDDDVAGGPVITGPSGAAGAASITHAVNENQNNGGTWSATGGTAWSLTGTDAGLLSISSGGVVTLASGNFDHEAKASYSFNVLRDAVAQAVTLNITDVAEPPLAPTIGTATAGNASASVAFTAPNNTGRPAITGYTATSSPGGFTGTGASSPITVSGLANGTPYTFTVTATNDEGTGPPSAASNSITPAAPGTAPTITVQPSNQTVTAGAAATFSVTATGSALTYQWRRNGTNISGATSSSYTTPATTVSGGSANNGDVYSVVVTGDTAPAATSSNATLTVNAATGTTLEEVMTDSTGSSIRLNQTTRVCLEPFTTIEALFTGTRTVVTGTTDPTTGRFVVPSGTVPPGKYAMFQLLPSTGAPAALQGAAFDIIDVV